MLSETYSTRQFYGPKPGPGEPLSLSLLLSPGAFMYAVSSGQFKTITELGHVQSAQPGYFAEGAAEKLPALVQNFFLHRKPFEKVNIALLNRQFTLVPEAYGQGDLKSLLRFASGLAEVKNTTVHQVKGIHFCYTAEHDLVNYLEKTFTNASIRHAGAVNLSLFFSQHSLAQAQVFLNIGDGCMELCIKENNELLFYNLFQFETNEDVLYYLLFTMEQFRQDPLQVKLAVAGERPPDDELLKSLKKYIRQVSFCVHDPSVQLNGDLKQLPQHYYFTLLNQHLCEL
jgi:hypothetical protein